MAKTFSDINGDIYEVDQVDYLDTDNDIISDKITGYFAYMMNDDKVEVQKKIYEAIKDYKKL
ncbi:hypothetical protein [Clostridium perfringens]|uniref:hypothetical protein n=1 Tax=Clostridium perfringens TaxID=1502 RepID=UPI00115E1E9D|nr:hypothetical protein [Clostridium perfringens]MDM0721922.1 hypothetical protein [Clostridium perfringens]MDM0724987.1 hypothetical protein [Clostridium perfringens]MDM0852913.1 hypothetical protein [Clostridium perfringens]